MYYASITAQIHPLTAKTAAEASLDAIRLFGAGSDITVRCDGETVASLHVPAERSQCRHDAYRVSLDGRHETCQTCAARRERVSVEQIASGYVPAGAWRLLDK